MVRIVKWLERLNEIIGRSFSWLILSMIAVTFLVVILRYLFQLGWIWMQESIIYMHAAFFLLTAAYTLLREGHVRVDIFYGKMNPFHRALVNFLGSLLLLLPFCLAIIFYGFSYVGDAWRRLEASPEAGGIPAIFLLKSLILILPALLALQAISICLRNYKVMKEWRTSRGE